MLFTDLSTGFVIFVCLFTAFAVALTWFVLKTANYCRDSVNYVLSQNKNSLSLRRMADVETTLTELTDSYDSMLRSHKKLRSRIGMRNNRDAAKNGLDSDSELATQPDKTKLRLAAKAAGLLR